MRLRMVGRAVLLSMAILAAAAEEDSAWYREFVSTFSRVRRRLLASGGNVWSEEDLMKAPRRLERAIERRCELFSDKRRWRHRSLVFTHVPKTGGQSLQMALYKNAKANKMEHDKDFVTGHVRYGDVLEWKPHLVRPPNEADFVTVLREPARLVQSDFDYMRRNPKHPGYKGAQRFSSLFQYLDEELDDGTGAIFALFTEYSRRNRTLEMLRSHCTRARFRGKFDPRLRRHCSDGWQIFLSKAAHLLATRYSVVGVLERLPETLEVARCRVPWLRNMSSIPVHNKRPREAGATPLRLLEKKMSQAQILYEAAHRMLDADLQCCRRRRKPS